MTDGKSLQGFADKQTKATLGTVFVDRITYLSTEGVVNHNSTISLKLFADRNLNTTSIVLMKRVRLFRLMSKCTIILRSNFYFSGKWEKLTREKSYFKKSTLLV